MCIFLFRCKGQSRLEEESYFMQVKWKGSLFLQGVT